MKIHLREWGTKPIQERKKRGRKKSSESIDDYLLLLNNVDLDELATGLDKLTHKPLGLVPPIPAAGADRLHRIAVSSEELRRRLHDPIYVPVLVTPNQIRDTVRLFVGARYRHFVFQATPPWNWYGMATDLLDGCMVHIAGGDPGRASWTWSEESLNA